MEAKLRLIILYGFNESTYIIFLNAQYLYKCITELLEMIYSDHFYMLNQNPKYKVLNEHWKFIEKDMLEIYFNQLRRGELDFNLRNNDLNSASDDDSIILNIS